MVFVNIPRIIFYKKGNNMENQANNQIENRKGMTHEQ